MDRDRASRLIGLLLWLYPKDFRRRFGPGMQADLEDRYLEASRDSAPGRSGLKWFWLRTAWDAVTLASVEYYEAMKRSTHRSARSDSSPTRSLPRVTSPLEPVIHDIRYATRLLVKDPFVSGIAVLTFGLGIALFATTFSIVYGSTWRGLPFDDPDELVHFERANPSQGLNLAVTPHDYMAWKEQQHSFEGLAAFVEAYINLADGAGPAEPQTGVYIDSEAFRLLRVQPLLGRIFRPAEHAIDGPRAILLSHGLWQNRYGGDSSIVGRTIRATEEVSAEYSVAGVMPEGFGFPIAEEFWLPLRLDINRIERGSGRLDVFGRLKSDVTFEQMETEFAAISLRLEREFPQTNTGIVAAPATFHDEYIGAEFTNRIQAMLAGSVLVLLIACINVTNLLLARVTRRRKEIAVRAALGAGRRRVISMILTETTLLAAIGAVWGIAAAIYGTQQFGTALINAGALRLPHGGDSLFWWEFKVDTVPMLAAIAAAAMCGALAGLIPAMHASGPRVSDVLKEESGKMSRSGFRRLGNALVTVEIALTMGLLVATGLTVRSVLKLRNADYAFESDRVLTARVGLWGERYSRDRAARAQFWTALEERLDAIPGVESATLMSRAPMMPARPTPVAIGGETYANAGDIPFARYSIVSPTYFEVYGVSVLEGRAFDGRDVNGGVPVAIVNQSFARRFFPDREVLGGLFRTGRDETGPLLTVVGVVPDLWMDGERNRDREGFYVPLAQRRPVDLMVAARTRGDPAALAPSLREALAGLDPDQPIYQIRSMSEVVHERTGRFRIYGSFYIAFGIAALFLALVGLYGVVSFTVTQQTSEIGVRIALGANQNDVVRSVLKFGALHVMWGLVAGVGIAFWISRGLASILFQVEPWNTPTVAGVALVLILTSLAACAIPARRASLIAPVIAMRHE